MFRLPINVDHAFVFLRNMRMIGVGSISTTGAISFSGFGRLAFVFFRLSLMTGATGLDTPFAEEFATTDLIKTGFDAFAGPIAGGAVVNAADSSGEVRLPKTAFQSFARAIALKPCSCCLIDWTRLTITLGATAN